MERPMGPRPDKRQTAYADIFGRPAATHHQYPRPPPATNAMTYSQSYNGQNVQYNQQYEPGYDPQQQSLYGGHHPPSAFRQHQHPQQQTYPMYSQYQHLTPHDRRYPRSSASSSRSTGVIAPYPQEPVDPSLEALTRTGMTPAQAYQAQVYSNQPQHAPQVQSQASLRPLSSVSDNIAHVSSPELRIPQLDFEPTDGRLDLDFVGGSSQARAYRTNGTNNTLSSRAMHALTLSDEPASYHNAPGPSSRPYPLQLETTMGQGSAAMDRYSPASSSYVDRVSSPPSSPRRSSDSIRTLPRSNGVRRDRSAQDRSRSMSATTSQAKSIISDLKRQASRPGLPVFPGNGDSHTLNASPSSRRTPIVYPALLSRVAQAFRERIQLGEKVKDGLTYTDAFDGREAVDKIAYIIKTTDRNLALLLGRALDAQKFFHDVTYDHRLRDTPHEIYKFRSKMPTPFSSGDLNGEEGDEHKDRSDTRGESSSSTPAPSREESPDNTRNVIPQRDDGLDDAPLPSGVFTLLTDCYSPTCSRDSLCYSIACPRRLEQQARLNLRPQRGLKRSSRESLADVVAVEPGTLWVHSVPQEVVDSVSDMEKKRQEAINEVIYTERDFVRDMEYLRDAWVAPLKSSPIIPEERRIEFLGNVFWNIHDIIAVNTRLRDSLNKRQKSYAIIERIGDIFLEHVPNFSPFVSYGAHQLLGKYEFEKEKSTNPEFQKFVDETERLPESRKLELNGYLTKPTTRLARYPLLLEVINKYTPDDNPDKKDLVRVIEMVREFLSRVNIESGKTENRFNLMQLSQQLVFRPGEEVDLKLGHESREIVYKGTLKRRGNAQGDSGDLQVFLFDHLLLMVKQKEKHKHEMHKVYRRPIPLELLIVCAPDDQSFRTSTSSRPSNRTLTRRNSFGKSTAPYPPVILPAKINPKDGFALTFVHLGRNGYSITLYASTQLARRKWIDVIQKQQEATRDRSTSFDTVTLSEGFFVASNRVNCAVPFDRGQRVAYGTNDGVYFSNINDPSRPPMRVLPLLDVTQIDILEEFQLLIVLSEHQVITFPLETLNENDTSEGLRRAKRIASHTTFFKAGTCLGRTLVCIVKASQFSSTIKALEPIEFEMRGKHKPTFKKLLQGGNDTLRLFREFYIPVESSSIHYLKTKLCVGCTKGFEIVDLETLDTQALLDPLDLSLDFVQKRDDVKPLAIYRIENDFLLCYDEFAFYVNKSGWRARKDFMISWSGHPRSFALSYPFVLAFDPTFIEVVHVITGNLTQVIQGNNLRCIFAEAPPSTTHALPRRSGGAPPSTYYQTPYGPMGAGHGLDPRMSVQGSRSSIVSSYSSHTYYDHGTPVMGMGGGIYGGSPTSYASSSSIAHSAERSEIIIVSDDMVMAVQRSGPTITGDVASSSYSSHTF